MYLVYTTTVRHTRLKQSSFHGDDVATVLPGLLRAERPTSYDHLNTLLLPLRFLVHHLAPSPQPTPPRVCLGPPAERGRLPRASR